MFLTENDQIVRSLLQICQIPDDCEKWSLHFEANASAKIRMETRSEISESVHPVHPTHADKITKSLLEWGVIPVDCTKWSLHFVCGSAISIELTRLAHLHELQHITGALHQFPDELARIERYSRKADL